MFSLFSDSGANPTHGVQLHRIERKLDLIIKHLGIELDEQTVSGASDQVRRLAESGRKIEAIKQYRAETGAGLKEAKEFVESLRGR